MVQYNQAIVPKWGAFSRWSSSLYSPVRNLDQMTIGKTHPTLMKVFRKVISISKIIGKGSNGKGMSQIHNPQSFFNRFIVQKLFKSNIFRSYPAYKLYLRIKYRNYSYKENLTFHRTYAITKKLFFFVKILIKILHFSKYKFTIFVSNS